MRRSGTAVVISPEGGAQHFHPLRLGTGRHSERWLQELVQANPAVLPVDDIEPGFGRLIPIAMEVPCSQGSIDNVFLTPGGNIVICELKLWKNPQSRREVVAQCLDYISALAAMDVESFERACLAGKLSRPAKQLYDFVAEDAEVVEEAEFLDTLSLNLKKGRILALAVGDGIRRETETLASLLAQQASTQFTFALVELGVYDLDNGQQVVIPNTLAKTAMIPRYVVIPVQTEAEIQDAATASRTISPPPSGSITETQFFELMSQRDKRLPDAIKSLLQRLEPLGVYPGWKASLNLYRDHPGDANPFNLGYIQKNGQFYTLPAGFFGRAELARPYHLRVAKIFGGQVSHSSAKDFYATTNGVSAPRIEQLLPAHENELFEAMKEYLERALIEAS